MSGRNAGTTALLICLTFVCSCGGASEVEQKQDPTPPPIANPEADQMLWDAALQGQMDMIVAAVDRGARIESTDPDGRTALMYAAFNGHTECVRWLIDRGADVGARENVGRTALMFSASGPFSETVGLLLEFGANPNDADEYEAWTPLMFAAAEGQSEVVEVLLTNGANPSAADKDGEVAADHAAANRHVEMESRLRQAMSTS